MKRKSEQEIMAATRPEDIFSMNLNTIEEEKEEYIETFKPKDYRIILNFTITKKVILLYNQAIAMLKGDENWKEEYHATEVAQTFSANEKCHTTEVVQIPTEGRRFKVNPLEIDRTKFKKPMSEYGQRLVQKWIWAAFDEVDKHPEKYQAPFETLIPEKCWDGGKDARMLEKYAEGLGGYMADWVEQALEWAQRISNGESWEDFYNGADTAKWFRMIIGHTGNKVIVGGLRSSYTQCLSDFVGTDMLPELWDLEDVVPLVVFKQK